MDTYLELYVDYLKNTKNMAANSLSAYRRDIAEFHRHLEGKGIHSPEEISNADVVSYIFSLKNSGRAASTVHRKMASVRSYCGFLSSEGILEQNPARDLKTPRMEKKELEYLTIEEVEAILAAPDDSVKGLRDRAILEMMYGTGIRVTEIASLRMSDINFRIGFITCTGEYGKARIIPLGRPCREALERYIDESRPKLIEIYLKHRSHSDSEENAEDGGEDRSEHAGTATAEGEADSGRQEKKEPSAAEGEAGSGRQGKRETKASEGGAGSGQHEKKETKAVRKRPKETESPQEYLFMNYHGEKLTRQGLWKIIGKYAQKAGIDKKLTPQMLRNSFAVHMVQNGADIKSIQELMGFEDAATAQIYLTVAKNRIKEVYDKTHPRA